MASVAPRWRRRLLRLPPYPSLACLMIFLAACRAFPIPEAQAEHSNPAKAAGLEQPPSSPTPVLVLPEPVEGLSKLADSGAQSPDLASEAILTPHTADALHFVFPSPGPAPISAWRPPLYPVPWAPTPFDHFYFPRPIGADNVNWPLADYRYGGVFFGDVVHTGVDIPAERGAQVLAAGPGNVTWAGFGLYALTEDLNDPYGLAVAIRHDFGYKGETLYTVYGHMEKIFVTRGQHVNTGELIGLVGDTGKVTGVHLHFEVRIGKNNFFGSRNPELWMSPPQGWGILAAQVMNTSGNRLEGWTVDVKSADSGQVWKVKTYGHGETNSDPYYQENIVLGDLPAGNYVLSIAFAGTLYNLNFQIQPGMVNYFAFQGRNGYNIDLPPAPGADFTPPPANLTPTP